MYILKHEKFLSSEAERKKFSEIYLMGQEKSKISRSFRGETFLAQKIFRKSSKALILKCSFRK